jgi:hypothetical protein
VKETRDRPAAPPREAPPAAPEPAPLAARYDVEDEERESETVLALLGGATRHGAWEPAEVVRAVAVMGGIKLDFRDADLLEGETLVHCLALMGGVEILVPPDVNADVQGTGLMGGFPAFRHRAPDPDAPTLRIRGVALMGGVDVKVKPA